MTQKLQQNLWAKAESASWLLSPANLLILFLPTQFGKHFWPDFSFVVGARVDYLSPTLYLTDIFIVLLFVLSFKKLMHFFLSERSKSKDLYLLFVLFASVSIFLSNSPMAGWYWLAKFLEMSFLVWCMANLDLSFPRRRESRVLDPGSPSGMTFVGLLFTIGIVFESILSIAQIIHQGSIGGFLYFLGERAFSASTPGIANASVSGELILRPYGTFSHPNMLAGYFLVAMLLAVYFYSSRERSESRSRFWTSQNDSSRPVSRQGGQARTRQVALLLSLLFGTVGLALTLSRVAIGAWLLIGCIVVMATYRERIAKTILFLSLSVGTVLLLVIMLFPPVVFRFLSLSFGESLQERVGLAKSALFMILAHPLFGVGPNNFISTLPLFSGNSYVLQPVHNIYLLVAAELGFPGLLLFCGFLWTIIKRLYLVWRKSLVAERNRLLPLGLALFAILFSGFFDHYFLTLQQGQLLFAIIIGVCVRVAKKELSS